MRTKKREAGLTVIELITTMSIASILAGLSIATFKQVRAKAGGAVADQALHDSRNALEAALVEPDQLISFVSTQVTTPGALSDPAAGQLLPGFMMPENAVLWITFNPNCYDSSCTAQSLIVQHCRAERIAIWERLGNGIEDLSSLPGPGCA